MTRDDNWERIQVTGKMEAEVLKAALETAGIPVVIEAETVGNLYGITAGGLGLATIFVPRDRADEARALLADSRALDMPHGD